MPQTLPHLRSIFIEFSAIFFAKKVAYLGSWLYICIVNQMFNRHQQEKIQRNEDKNIQTDNRPPD